MVPLTITFAGGQRVITAYALEVESVQYARRSEPNALPGTPTLKWGDNLPLPSPYEVTAFVGAATLTAAKSLAYVIASEAQLATLVTTYEGTRAVDGLLEYEIASDGDAWVRLALVFAATREPLA